MSWNARRILSFLVFSGLGLGCQGAAVKIAFDNRTAAVTQALSLSAGRTPTVFGVRLVGAFLSEDEDGHMDNVGKVGRIWANPVCDPDLRRCGIGPSSGANRVTDYFDLALPTDEVNARLNAQEHVIDPGTYRILRLDLAGPQPTDEHDVPNLRFGMMGQPPSEVRRTNVYVVHLDPPLVLADGDSVTMSLGYDVRDGYFDDPAMDEFHPPEGTGFNDWYCGDRSHEPARGPCLAFTGFSPGVTRNAR